MCSVFKRLFSLALAAVMIIAVILVDLSIHSYAAGNDGFSFSGSGTEDDPYLISTVDELVEMRDGINARRGSEKYYKLTNDMDLSDIDNWIPIGGAYNQNEFCGVFDGGGYEVKNMTINCSENNQWSDYLGFFGSIQYGTVKNLTVSGSVAGKSRLGGIAGMVRAGTLENCVNKCTVTSVVGNNTTHVGGIVGDIAYYDFDKDYNLTFIPSSVINCVNLGNVNGYAKCGGITGEAACVIIENCRNEGDICGDAFHIGGIAGYARDTSDRGKLEITDCENKGKIKGNNKTGGIVGALYSCGWYISTVNNSINSGDIEGEEKIGGICGYNDGGIELCVNKGAVNGGSKVGGVCGENDKQNVVSASPVHQIGIRNCINEGRVSGTDNIGGLVGYRIDPITSYNVGSVVCSASNAGGVMPGCSRYSVSFFDSDLVTGSSYSDAANTAKTTESFNSGEVAWLLSQEEKGQGEIWGQNIDNDQPKQDYPVFNGAKVYRYEIVRCDGQSKSPQKFGYTNNAYFGDTLSEHTLTLIDAKDADCANKGNIEYWHCSVCGKNFTDSDGTQEVNNVETDITTEHKWNDGEIIKQPTEAEEGVMTYTCMVCGAEKTETIDKLEHTHIYSTEWTSGETDHWHAATCGHDVKSGLAAHTWNNGEITTEPTEGTAGVTTYTCTVCGAAKDEPIAPLGHTHSWCTDWSMDEANHWRDCLNGCVEKKDLSAHNWNEGEITKQPTTEAEGQKTFECTVCGQTRTEPIPIVNDPSEDSSVSVEIRPGKNAPATQLKTSDNELIKIVLTSEEQELVGNGVDIKIILTVDDAAEAVSADDKAKIETAIRGLTNYMLGQYLDVNLLKIIGNSQENVAETKSPITVMFEIPKALRGKGRSYSVIRVHNGETTVLPDLDNDADTVTIKSDKFSTYALAYSEEAGSTPPSGGSSGSSKPSSGGNRPTSSNGDSGSTSTPADDNNSDSSPVLTDESSTDSSEPVSSESDPTESGDTPYESDEPTFIENETTESENASSDSSPQSSDNDGGINTDDRTSGENNSSQSEDAAANNNDNPATGIAVSLVPLATAVTILTVAAKRRKK